MRPTGLRESKKAATRFALAQAVLALATRVGIDAVTIEAVAAEAGVSVRTFHNYFGGKEDALVFFVSELVDRIATGVSARPAAESFWASLRFVMTEIATGSEDLDPEVLATLLRLFDTEPTLTAHSQQVDLVGTVGSKINGMISDRGLDPDSLYPRLVFTTALCTARTAIEFWGSHRTPDGDTAREALDAAFDQLDAGIARPLSN